MTITHASTRSSRSGVGQVPAIAIDGISKHFRDGNGQTVVAVDRVSLTIQPGEVVAFLGSNGAGKSTTIDMMLGLTSTDSGTVKLFGRPPLEAVQSGQVSAMLQSGGLLPELSVKATMRMLGSLYPDADVDACMRRARIDSIADRQVSLCSGGEQQRLRFGLSLLSDPDLMVLDEPTAAMDVEARRQFWEELRADASRGKTVLFATHYLEEADQFADRIVLISHGRIIADDTTDAIRAAAAGRVVSAALSEQGLAFVLGDPDTRLIEQRGGRVYLDSNDTDELARRVLATDATALEVTPRSLEDAVVALTTTSKEN